MTAQATTSETAALSMLMRLNHLVRSSRVYADSHSALKNATHAIGEQLEAVLDGAEASTLHIIEDRVLVGNRLLQSPPGVRASIRQLGQFWTVRGVGGMQITKRSSQADIQPLVRTLLGHPRDGETGHAALNQQLVGRGVRGITLLGPRTLEDTEEAGADKTPCLNATRLFLRALRGTHALQQAPITPAMRLELQHIAHKLVELYTTAPLRALALARPKELVPAHLSHPFHVAVYSVAVGQALGIDRSGLEELVMSSLALAPGLDPTEESDAEPRRRPPPAADMATSTAPSDGADGIQHARALRHLLGDGALSPTDRRMLRTVFEHNMGQHGEGPPHTLRWVPQHPYTRIIGASAQFNNLRTGQGTGRPSSPDQALKQMKLETGRYHPDVLSKLETLIPVIEVIAAYA